MAINVLTLADAIVSVKMDDTQFKTDLNKLGREFNHIANEMFKVAIAPGLLLGGVGLHNLLKSNDESSIRLSNSMLNLNVAFLQFSATVGKVLVDTFHLDSLLNGIANILNEMPVSTILKMVGAFTGLFVLFSVVKLTAFYTQWKAHLMTISYLTNKLTGETIALDVARGAGGAAGGIGAAAGGIGAVGTSLIGIAIVAAITMGFDLVGQGIDTWSDKHLTKTEKAGNTALLFGEGMLAFTGFYGIMEGIKGMFGEKGRPKLDFGYKGTTTSSLTGLNQSMQDFYNKNSKEEALITALEDNTAATKADTGKRGGGGGATFGVSSNVSTGGTSMADAMLSSPHF